MRGIAEGAGVDLEDVLAINVRTEVMFAAKARAARGAGARPPLGVLVVRRPARGDAAARRSSARTGTGSLHCFDTVVVLEAEQDDGPDYVTVVEAGLLAKTGMNSPALGVATNALVTRRRPRRARRSRTTCCFARSWTARRSRTRSPSRSGRARSSSANYLLGARGRRRGRHRGDARRLLDGLFLLFPDDGLLLHTNHFRSPAFDRRDVSLWVMPD